MGGKVYPRCVYSPCCYGPWLPGQALEGSSTSRMAVQWVAKSSQGVCIAPGAMGSGCMCKPLGAVAPAGWQCSGWQSLSKMCVEAMVLWPLVAWASPWGQWHQQDGSAVGCKVYPRCLCSPWCYGLWLPGQGLGGSGTNKKAVQWVAQSITDVCIGPGAMAPVCLGKPWGAVAPAGWQCSGWQSLSKVFV